MHITTQDHTLQVVAVFFKKKTKHHDSKSHTMTHDHTLQVGAYFFVGKVAFQKKNNQKHHMKAYDYT